MVRHSVDEDSEISKAKLVDIAEHDDHISIRACKGKHSDISIQIAEHDDTEQIIINLFVHFLT